ncbi:MAG: 2'-5' RNA ligase family protein, partial [Candidatus Limnocylindria bacterium]
FPPAGRPRVVWLGIREGSAALGLLASRVAAELSARSLAFDPRPFQPHLTLARVHDGATLADARALAARLPALAAGPFDFAVEAIHVMRSDLSPRGPRYTSLAVAGLG